MSNNQEYEKTKVNEQVLLLNPNAFLPSAGTNYSACKDLYSPEDHIIPPHTNLLIKTNIALFWDNNDYYVQLLSRSGLAYKYNVIVQAGVIDRDYRKNIGVLLQNNSNCEYVVKRGDRIAQYAYIKKASISSTVVTEFTELIDNNRIGGFGSTNK